MPAPMPHVTCLADLVRIAARRDPAAVAIEHDRGRTTYAQLVDRSVRMASAMRALGLAPGDRVALFAQNCPEYLESYLGLQWAGLVAVPANYRLTPPELSYLLDNSGAKALLIGEEYLPYLDRLRADGKRVPSTVVVYGSPQHHANAYERALEQASPSLPPRTFGPGDPTAIFYTSGTTGFPKGAVMSHAVILSRFGSWGWRYGITEEEVTLVPGPIFHQSFGSVALLTLSVGGRVVLRREFSPEHALDDLQRFGVTWAFLVPTMMGGIAKAANALGRTLDLPRLRGLMSSGSRLQLTTIEGFEAAFPRARLADTYGWTESGWITYCRHEDILGSDRSVGRASFGCELAILDEDGNELPRGREGTIYACNPIPFLGYHENADATRSMRVGRWETGGDVGLIDERGFLHILDRKKDLIVSGGENIYPAEIERVLVDHPKILDVAVVGVPDERWGESPRACVVPRRGESVTIEEIVAFCDGKIARYKHPKSLHMLEILPRNSMGKVLRRQLREQFWNDWRKGQET
ncbi:MAG: AMP-binding protein [Proteobacteria bacterium]|nr:AMP-binding protein [Pseudomonadota bacterium]